MKPGYIQLAEAKYKYEALLKALERESDPVQRRKIKSQIYYYGNKLSRLS